ncbi:MAG: sodium:proton antiporter NhaD [Glaciecola sp.]
MKTLLAILFLTLISPSLAVASEAGPLDLVNSVWGYAAVIIFFFAYILVIGEEYLHLRKSKPVLVAAGIIWLMLGFVYSQNNLSAQAEYAFGANLLEYAQLLLFLLVAMTYINAMEDRGIFNTLRAWLESKGFSLRSLFWITGVLAFFISSFANNLTTAMLMCAIVLNVAQGNAKFTNLACINIVVAANAGGAFSPFGDITTLMVWQAGFVNFNEFFVLFLPAIVSFMIPALIMSLFISKQKSEPKVVECVEVKRGAKRIVLLFCLTIVTAVFSHSALGMPPVLGMMLGLGYLKFFGFYLRKSLPKSLNKKALIAKERNDQDALEKLGNIVPFDVFTKIARAEWDTLLFFYGVVMCVGGLGFIGYLSLISQVMYSSWDPTFANVAIGLISAVIDNIPVVFAVLAMAPDMGAEQWLLVSLTSSTGGSILSIGSAAGVALMGQSKGLYTFMGHLKWSWAILLGYAASVAVHIALN